MTTASHFICIPFFFLLVYPERLLCCFASGIIHIQKKKERKCKNTECTPAINVKTWIAGSVHGTLKNRERCGMWLRCIAWGQDAVRKSRLFCLLGEDKNRPESSQGTHKSTQPLLRKSGENTKCCSCNAPVNVLAHSLYGCQLGLVKGACFVDTIRAKPQAAGVLTNHSCIQSLLIAEDQSDTLGLNHLSHLLKLLGQYTKQFAITVC